MASTNVIQFPKTEQQIKKIQKLNELSSKLEEAEHQLKIIELKLKELIKKAEIKL